MTVEEFRAFAEKNGGMEKVMAAARELKEEGKVVSEDTLSLKLYGDIIDSTDSQPVQELPSFEEVSGDVDLRDTIIENDVAEKMNRQPAPLIVKILVGFLPFIMLMIFLSPQLSKITGISQHTFFEVGFLSWVVIFFIIFLIGMIKKKKFSPFVIIFFLVFGIGMYKSFDISPGNIFEKDTQQEVSQEDVYSQGEHFLSSIPWEKVFTNGAKVNSEYECRPAKGDEVSFGDFVVIAEAEIDTNTDNPYSSHIYCFVNQDATVNHIYYENRDKELVEWDMQSEI